MAQKIQIEDIQFPSEAQLLREGRANLIQAPIYSTPLATNSNFGAILLNLQLRNVPGRAALLTGLTASCTGPAQVYTNTANIMKQLGNNLAGQAVSTLNAVWGVNGGIITSNQRTLVYSEGLVDLVIKYLGEDNSPTPYVGGSISVIDFTADFNYWAKKKILVIGESTSWSSMENDANGIAYPGDKLWCFQVAAAMRQAGKSVRLINKAFGSMSSNHMEYARRSGFYDCDYDAIFVNLGQNDANTAASGLGTLTPEARYKEQLANIIAMRNKGKGKNVPIVFISCFPTDVATIPNYRTWMQDVAQDTLVGGGIINNVWFIDGSAAFPLNGTPTADLNFATSNRVAGQRIHYSGEGQTYNAEYVLSQIITQNWYNNF